MYLLTIQKSIYLKGSDSQTDHTHNLSHADDAFTNTYHDQSEHGCWMACLSADIRLAGWPVITTHRKSSSRTGHKDGTFLELALDWYRLGAHLYMAYCHYMPNAPAWLCMFLLSVHSWFLIVQQQMIGFYSFVYRSSIDRLLWVTELRKLECLRTLLLGPILIHPA